MMRRKYLLCFIIITLAIPFFGIWQTIVFAQIPYDWAIAKPIPFYDDIRPPIMIADQNQTVHAFNSENLPDDRKAVFYRTWKLNSGWSQPVDILIPQPTIGSPLQGVFLDKSNYFHMIYYLGSIYRGDIYYSKAWLPEASSALGWSSPKKVAEGAYPLPDAAITGDGGDDLYIVYTGVEEGVGVYEVHSEDGGVKWSEPTNIFLSQFRDTVPFHIKLYLDKSGNLHAVWSIVSERGLGLAVYYARRDKDSGMWNQPFLIAAVEGDDYAADWATIIDYDDELILMYMDGTVPNGIPPTRWMRRSVDNGDSWDSPVQPFPQVGENGFAIMLIDSNSTMHIVLANRVGDPAIGGMWHGIWLGDKWSDLELITASSPEKAISSGSYWEVEAAHSPTAVISQGNIILTAWWHNLPDAPPAGFSYTILDAPELPIEPLPSLSPEPTREVVVSQPNPVGTLLPTEQHGLESLQPEDFSREDVNVVNPVLLVFLGILPALLVVIIFIVIRPFGRGK